jgi:hypothetical protein
VVSMINRVIFHILVCVNTMLYPCPC